VDQRGGLLSLAVYRDRPSATREEYERAHALIWKPPRLYSEEYPGSLFMVVRKSDLDRLEAAALIYAEVELLDIDALPPEEARVLDREMIEQGMAILLDRMRRET
jgi:hypothetical protein